MINIVFLCCEITKGMKSFGPKALIPMGKKHNSDPLIVRQIKEAQKTYQNIPHKIHVIVGFEHDRVLKAIREHKKINTIIYDKYANTNSAGAVIESINRIGEENYLLIENGIISKYKPKQLTNSTIPVIKNCDNTLFAIGVTESETRAEYLFYDLDPKWPEVVFMHRSDLNHIMKVSDHDRVQHMFLFEYLNFLTESGISFYTDYTSGKKFNKVINHKVATI